MRVDVRLCAAGLTLLVWHTTIGGLSSGQSTVSIVRCCTLVPGWCHLKFVEWVAGDTRANLERSNLARETRRICQEIRTYQNLIAFILVVVVGFAYMFSVWGRSDNTALVLWYICFTGLTLIRALVYETVRKSLPTATPAALVQNELRLVGTGVIVSTMLGMSYWVVGIPGDEHAVLAITVLNCVYATGAAINGGTQSRHVLFYLIAILGQSVAFWLGLGGRTDYALSLLLTCLFLLLYTFALRNRGLVVDSIRMRLENKDQNERLIRSRGLVEDALESALQANRSKNNLIATVSHDLVQPIHALTFLLKSLKLTVPDSQSDQNAPTAEGTDTSRDLIIGKMETCVSLLERQFAGFVVLSRYDELKVKRYRVDLVPVCQLLVDNARLKAEQQHVTVSLRGDAPVMVDTDSVLMGRLLGNLLDNAVKFSAGGSVELTLQRRGDWVILEVSDTGIGISRGDLQKIFTDFVQLRYQSETGAGLGLPIVRRIADALGIEVTVESKVGAGTCFRLLMPARRGTSQLPPVVAGYSMQDIVSTDISLAAPRINLQGKTVMLVTDDTDRPDALVRYIQDLGGHCVTATSATDAIAFVAELPREKNRATEPQHRPAIDMAIVHEPFYTTPGARRLCIELAETLGEDRVVLVTASEVGRREIEASGISVYSRPLRMQQLQAILSARLGIGLR